MAERANSTVGKRAERELRHLLAERKTLEQMREKIMRELQQLEVGYDVSCHNYFHSWWRFYYL